VHFYAYLLSFLLIFDVHHYNLYLKRKTMSQPVNQPGIMTPLADFNTIQSLLVNPTPEAVQLRNEISRQAAHLKTVAGLATAVFALCCAGSLATAAGLAFVASATLAFGCREIFVIAGNVVNTLNNNGTFGNITTRMTSALTPQWFVDAIFANTYFAGPVFSASLVQEYEVSLKAPTT
jgi:hypothetical protein